MIDLKNFFSQWLQKGAIDAISEVQQNAATAGFAGRIRVHGTLPTHEVKIEFVPGKALTLSSVGGRPLPPGTYKVLMLITREDTPK